MNVTDEMAKIALDAFTDAVSDCGPCGHCDGRGFHHGFGETGHDPDWCDVCGGNGFASVNTEREAMKIALRAALSPHQTSGDAK